MLVNIINGRPVGYLTLYEYAAKEGQSEAAVRSWIFKGLLQTLRIGTGNRTLHFILPDAKPVYKSRKKRGSANGS